MTSGGTASGTQRLTRLVAAKLQLVKIVENLARRQLDFIHRGEMAALLKLLAAKQTVLAQLQAVERQLDPFRSEDPVQRAWNSPAERAACQAQAEQCNALLAKAMDLEKEAEAAMLHQREETARQLALAQAAADARLAYAALPPPLETGLRVEG